MGFEELIQCCRAKLLENRSLLLNKVAECRLALRHRHGQWRGDEADQTQEILDEKALFSLQQRTLHQLFEVDSALSRIENSCFGVCEETDEAIEQERLLAIPWTRLSIEGAEIREAREKRPGLRRVP